MTQKILITGGAGFIGSHLVDICLEAGHEVLVYDNFSVGHRAHLQNHPSLTIAEKDILKPEEVQQEVDKFEPDIIYHLAAIHFIPACENDPAFAFRINVEGTHNVLKASRNKDIKVIFTSTGAIYDPSIDEELLETSPVDSKDIYGLTKHTAERYLEYHVAKGFGHVTVARLFNAVGRRETNPHLIPAIMDQLSRGDRTIELGNLYPRRDYIHVEDLAAGLYSLKSLSKSESLDFYNIGSGKEFSVQQLVDVFIDTIKEDIKIEQVASRMRKMDRPGQLAGISKIYNATGWAPRKTLELAVSEIWNELLLTKKN